MINRYLTIQGNPFGFKVLQLKIKPQPIATQALPEVILSTCLATALQALIPSETGWRL